MVVRVSICTTTVERGAVRRVKGKIFPQAPHQIRVGQKWNAKGDQRRVASTDGLLSAREVVAIVRDIMPAKFGAKRGIIEPGVFPLHVPLQDVEVGQSSDAE